MTSLLKILLFINCLDPPQVVFEGLGNFIISSLMHKGGEKGWVMEYEKFLPTPRRPLVVRV